ncbi:cytochrome c peroxidase [Kordiimonas aquimaris]|uniref:cytochrome c peroxidase n=1 Tax=Kordiimonas aquimaris TaxID=707591 RepID=UPI0021D09FA7|nr:cytochrome c peroxidase [Kordiimonas aquimaris]
MVLLTGHKIKVAQQIKRGTAAVLALVLVACNGDSSTPATTTTPTTVPATNNAPVVNIQVPDQTATEGVAFTFDATQNGTTFSDSDGDTLAYSVTFDLTDTGLTATGGEISGTPTIADTIVVTITASDGNGASASDNFLITINPATAALTGPSLPDTPFNYADQDLPDHFTNPNANLGNVDRTDNTPNNNPITDAGATLGRVLFYDKSLSANDTVACASCHVQENGFSDTAVLSIGFEGGETGRHSMRLGNARYYQRGRFFWDERAATLEQQVLQPIQDSVEMGLTLTQLEAKLIDIDYYGPLFEDAFGDDQVTSNRVSLALSQFVRSLTTYQSKFDEAYIAASGNPNNFDLVFTAQEQRGFDLFRGRGNCDSCHSTSAHVSDNVHNNGLDIGTTGDQGAGNQRFKAPSLRNSSVGGPFMHDGRFATLADVVDFYSDDVQDNPNLSNRLRNNDGTPRRLNLSAGQKADLVAFLETLTDETFLTDPKFSDPFLQD